MIKAMIKYDKENGKLRYFDRNGKEIVEGCEIRYCHGDRSLSRIKEVYLTEEGELGTDATSEIWIECGRAVPCEYGIYPFTEEELEEIEVVEY